MKELVVISGKGGTGKTSILASLAALCKREHVLVDADVDAANLHLVVRPETERRELFEGGAVARCSTDACAGCGACVEVCRFGAASMRGPEGDQAEATLEVDELRCEGCGACVQACTLDAIEMVPKVDGEWFVSRTRLGPMVHAELGHGGENSGKLVALVRREGRRLAEEHADAFVLTDGPPGLGCPVIAAIGGADLLLVVTEPTPSGRHDLERVLDLARHFDVPACVCLNKWDLHPDAAQSTARAAAARGAPVIGRLRYAAEVTEAQLRGLSLIEADPPEDLAAELHTLASAVFARLDGGGRPAAPRAERAAQAGSRRI